MRRNNELEGGHQSASGVGRRARPLVSFLAAVSVAATAAVISVSPGVNAQQATTANGLTSADAAASCWEIKQLHPSSGDGVYWLRNSELERPGQYYCDMTTDGGGWVLIGRGREGWTFRDYGQSTPEQLIAEVNGPGAFSPAALSSTTIDGLLGGGNVKDLADGVRVRRATNASGSNWQELRWNFLDLEEWSWAIGGGHRLASFSINGTTGTGSNTKDSTIRMAGEVGTGNRSGWDYNGWFTYPWSGHSRQAGFSFTGSVGGSNNATSYLWEYASENQAIPFTQLFIRPRLSTAPGTPIPDSGLEAATLTPMIDDRPEEIAGGVVGVLKVGDSEPNFNAPVLAITTLGDRVYVGGKFSDVRDTRTGGLVRHSYLAAFDRQTGAWIPSFRPQLDGTVWDLEVVDGRLIVAGQFTNINGVADTTSMAAIDPITGEVDTSWKSTFRVTGTTARPMVTSTDVEGDWIYVGGNFSRITGPSGQERSMGRLARVSAATGEPDTRFRPNVAGVPYSIDAQNGLIQVVGAFDGINGDSRQSIGTLNAETGEVIAGLDDPVWTTATRRYQLAVLSDEDVVWIGGSEHNTQAYDVEDYSLLQSDVGHDQGGDTQVLAKNGNMVAHGSHANAYVYQDAVTWPGLTGYTRVDIINWIGLWNAETYKYERDWVPGLGSAYTAGIWALHTDEDGCLWFGGDALGGPYRNGQRQYLESFSKFCQRDTVAPSTPGASAATVTDGEGVEVTWSASTDDAEGYIGYEILRNDKVISPLVYGTSYVDPSGTSTDRYFVRAVDTAGNRSATTAVLTPGDNQAPTTPGDLRAVAEAGGSVTLTWTASTDDVEVANYRVFQDGVEVNLVPGTETTHQLIGLAAGTYSIQVQAVDNAGNESAKTPSVEVNVGGDDVTNPSTPRDLVVVGDSATASLTATWSASTDNVGVTAYAIFRNGTEIAEVGGDVTTVTLDVGYGDHYIQVQALDAAGNRSWKTPSTRTRIVPPTSQDTSNPSTPRNLAFVVNADTSVDLTWTPSTDNVGVDRYRITRNGTEVMVVPGSQSTAHVVGLGYGTHYLQVQAFDAAGNSSWKTPSVTAVIVPPVSQDTSNPSTPRDLVVTVQPDGTLHVSWSASRDNVGVAAYRLYRNSVEVATVPGTETSTVLALGSGTHYVAVQAVDAAGNTSWKTPSTATVVP